MPFALLLASVLAAAPAEPAPPKSPEPDADLAVKAAVQALLNKQAAAWNDGDLDAFCAPYADDATFLSPSGVTRGRQNVLARYRKRYPDKAAMGTLTFDFIETRLARDPARVHAVSVAAHWHLSYPNKPKASGVTLLVLHPRGDAWMIVQDASM